METERRWDMRSVRTRRPLESVVERMSREWELLNAEGSARTTDILSLFHGPACGKQARPRRASMFRFGA